MAYLLDVYFKVFATLVCAIFAALVLAGGTRRVPNVFLGTFLLLIAGNQGAEALRALAATPAEGIFWFRIATVFAAVDPLALFYFVAIYTGHDRLRRTPAVFTVVLGSAIFAFLAPFTLPPEKMPVPVQAYTLGLTLFTAAVYAVALWAALRDRASRTGDAWGPLCAALAVAALPAWSRAGGRIVALLEKTGSIDPAAGPVLSVAIAILAPALVGGVVLYAARHGMGQKEAASSSYRAILLGMAMSVALVIPGLGILHMMGAPIPAPYDELLVRSGPSLRWLLFGILVSIAVVRHDLLSLSLASRRRAARVLLGVVFAVATFFSLLLMQAPRGSIGRLEAAEWVLIGLAIAASQGFRRLIDAAAFHVYRVPRPGDLRGRHDAYRLAAARLALEAPRDRAPDLERLRADLEIEEDVARVLERVAESDVRAPLDAGHRVAGRYEVVRLIGRGGSGRVFLARDQLLQRDVALKEIPVDGEAPARAAIAEAQTAGSIGHPNVVTVHDMLRRRASCILVTEYLPGGSLAARVESWGPLGPAEGVRLVEDIAQGLAAVHAKGIIHRDLKPANVLLAGDGRAKLADFGLARMHRDVTLGIEAPAGTPGFMAPEQRRGERPTTATDVYAVGAIARACVGGPLPEAVAAVFRRALAEAPEERWRDAVELFEALRLARGSRPVDEERASEADDIAVLEGVAGPVGKE